jgi:hypothetical protein
MGIGKMGTLCITAKRTVKDGGVLTYLGSTYQADELIPYAGQQVLIAEGRAIHSLNGLVVYEFWVRHIPPGRTKRGTKRKHSTQTIIEKTIVELREN